MHQLYQPNIEFGNNQRRNKSRNENEVPEDMWEDLKERTSLIVSKYLNDDKLKKLIGISFDLYISFEEFVFPLYREGNESK